MNHTSPHPYLIAALRRSGAAVRDLHWAESENGKRPLGRVVEFRRFATAREHPMTVRLISPRLFVELVRAKEDVVVVYELGLVGLYAGLSKLLRPHKVISLVEADYRHSGRTGTIGVKVALRRFAARFVDVFVTNNPSARDYVMATLGVPEEKIVVGWWLAGLPSELESRAPKADPVPEGVPLFVCASRLIPLKGVDLLIKAVATYRQRFGPCALWVIGDGPERDSLVQLAQRLGVEDSVTFLGAVDHATLKGAFEACDAFVFPTLQDLVGRVVVEALTAGAPVIASPMTGAVATIVHDDMNGIVVDPRAEGELAAALHRATDPQTAHALHEGVQRMNAALRPDAAAEVLLRALALARNEPPAGRDAELRPIDPRAADKTSAMRPRRLPVPGGRA
jgi:glycosyltransferase involved in cell wall biosynthesis